MTKQLTEKKIAKNRFFAFFFTMPWLIYKERHKECFLLLASYLIIDIIFSIKTYFSPLSTPSKITDIIPLILTAIFSLLYLFKAKKISQGYQQKEKDSAKKAKILIFILIAATIFPAIEYIIAQVANTKWQKEYKWFVDKADNTFWDLNPIPTLDGGFLFTCPKKLKGNNSKKNGLYLIKMNKSYKIIWQTRIEKKQKDASSIKEMPNKTIVVYTAIDNKLLNIAAYKKNKPICRYHISSTGQLIKKDSPLFYEYLNMYLAPWKNILFSGIKEKNGLQIDEDFNNKRVTLSLKKMSKTVWAFTLYQDFKRHLLKIHIQKDNTIIISYKMDTKAFTGIVLYKISRQGKLLKRKLFRLPRGFVFTYIIEHKNGQKTLIIEWAHKPKIAMVKLDSM